jgi:hypothetical protein
MPMSSQTQMQTSARGCCKKQYEPKKGNIVKLKSYLKEKEKK